MRSENARDWPDAIENAPNESPLRHQPAVARSVLPCCSTGREPYYSAREHKTEEHAAEPCHTLTAPIALCRGTSTGACRSSSAAKRRTLHSVQTRGDPPKFRRRVFLSERRTGEQVLAHGQASHEDRLESNIADELFCDGDGLLVVAGDRHTDEAALPVGDWADPPIADPVESPHDPRPWQQLGAGQPGAALLVDPLHQLGAVASRDGVADVEDQRLRRLRSEEHTSELQSPCNLVCRLLLEKKKK